MDEIDDELLIVPVLPSDVLTVPDDENVEVPSVDSMFVLLLDDESEVSKDDSVDEEV